MGSVEANQQEMLKHPGANNIRELVILTDLIEKVISRTCLKRGSIGDVCLTDYVAFVERCT